MHNTLAFAHKHLQDAVVAAEFVGTPHLRWSGAIGDRIPPRHLLRQMKMLWSMLSLWLVASSDAIHNVLHGKACLQNGKKDDCKRRQVGKAIQSHWKITMLLKTLHNSLFRQVIGQPDSTVSAFKVLQKASYPYQNQDQSCHDLLANIFKAQPTASDYG